MSRKLRLFPLTPSLTQGRPATVMVLNIRGYEVVRVLQVEGTAREAKAWRESRDCVLEPHVGQCG